MICTKCSLPIEQKIGYFRTRKGAHHFNCGVSNLPDADLLNSNAIEQMIEMYDGRGPSTTKYEAMREIAKLAIAQRGTHK